ncbi:MAG TPA: thiamine pyrophosphate-dependent enzyme, partial [Pirellulales bacterium]|nr:thiamine pyrophosphate-dependent enzyme [Pirellulales bacterium]
INGDGAMLMSLGVLVTIASVRAANYTLIVLDNGLYEVTGGQATAAAGTHVDFAAMARAAGFASASNFTALDDWRANAARCLSESGPRFICLKVESVGDAYALPPAGSVVERLKAFGAALTSNAM